VRREVERAASKGKAIYPVRIEDVPPSPKLEYFVAMHHWVNAWDGLFAEHARRIADAIQSQEEWIGNKVTRRRRLAISGSVLAVIAIGIVFAVISVFGGDLRRVFMSPQDRALAELADAGVSFDAAGFANVATIGDVHALELFDRAGFEVRQIETAFRRPGVAESYFRSTDGKTAATEWWKATLARGLDPNLTLDDDLYQQQGLLRTALISGNLDATVAMLDAGASPYSYQNLWLTYFSQPRFVFPYTYIADADEYSAEEKATLAAAFARTGVGVSLPTSIEGYPVDETRKMVEAMKADYGVDVPVTSSICTAVRTRVCETASERTGFDWCGFAESLPARVSTKDTVYDEFANIELAQLVNVVNDKAYVLANLPSGWRSSYGMVEISRDGRKWSVLKYVDANIAGMGLCKADEHGYVGDDCWRRIQLEQTSDPARMRQDDYYDYAVEQCTPPQ
jgi:hypothetical protein